MNTEEFRKLYPEFSDEQTFPEAAVQSWLDLADKTLPAERWRDWREQGQALFTAHFLVLAARDQKAALSGGGIGMANGMMSSKSVDKVSVSYDSGAISMADGGHWNMTSYGIRFLTTARMVGTGPIQL